MLWLILLTACRPDRCTVSPPNRPLDAPPALASELRERLVHATTTGRATIVISEDELTALLRQTLAGGPAHNATLHVTGEAIYVQVTLGRQDIPIQATLVPLVENGRLAIQVRCLAVGGKPTLRATRAALESVLSALASDAVWSPYIAAVTLRDGYLVLETGLSP